MIITKEDVGRKVRLRNGDVDTIVDFNIGKEYPVVLDNEDYINKEGFFWGFNEPEDMDIVAFVEEVSNTIQETNEASHISFGIEPNCQSMELVFGEYIVTVKRRD